MIADDIADKYSAVSSDSNEQYALWLCGIEFVYQFTQYVTAIATIVVETVVLAYDIYHFYVSAKSSGMKVGQEKSYPVLH